jgi:hypothetical protein
LHGPGDFSFQAGIEQSDEAAGDDEPVDLVSADKVGGACGDFVGLAFEVVIRILEQAETFIGHGHFGRQHPLQAFEVRAIGGCWR